MTENTTQTSYSDAQITRDDNRLIWLDMEMTGLNPQADKIIELAIVITDATLVTIAEAPVWVIHQSDETLNAMDEWNTKTHGQSGLIDKVKVSTLSEAEVEQQALAFISQYIGPNKSPMCGNSIGQDRRFMVQYMPTLEKHFHYRNLDVSTLKELARRWNPRVYDAFKKETRHTALADVYESIDELKHYREHLFVKP
ncbi:oligoribonuclease [Formosimonas limnophila]|uniref:Oligoribonuclease n=1 Tax=Formosimonas limnophila TaxID=1384487 RepID=A0A8J3CG00_9BURK|nr:oligoribonuclease [Formosimonas limnophila]GHA66800.1 oligoribonuclease [Formosimonas limnophila]